MGVRSSRRSGRPRYCDSGWSSSCCDVLTTVTTFSFCCIDPALVGRTDDHRTGDGLAGCHVVVACAGFAAGRVLPGVTWFSELAIHEARAVGCGDAVGAVVDQIGWTGVAFAFTGSIRVALVHLHHILTALLAVGDDAGTSGRSDRECRGGGSRGGAASR